MPDEKFASGNTFSLAFVNMLRDALEQCEDEEAQKLYGMASDFIAQNPQIEMDEMFKLLSCMCRKSTRPIVLMIDEVDSAGNNQVFVQFLALLRGSYLDRDQTPTFHSVILAGVYDIKNLKLKMGRDGERQYNSPWNIAARFTVDMSFSAEDIAGMLMRYKTDQSFDIDVPSISRLIYDYTSGYPFLVSRICKI